MQQLGMLIPGLVTVSAGHFFKSLTLRNSFAWQNLYGCAVPSNLLKMLTWLFWVEISKIQQINIDLVNGPILSLDE